MKKKFFKSVQSYILKDPNYLDKFKNFEKYVFKSQNQEKNNKKAFK
jgi:hypothetical protein